MIFKVFFQYLTALLFFQNVKAFPLQDQFVHPNEGSSFLNIHFPEELIADNPNIELKNSPLFAPSLIQQEFHDSESQSHELISPDTYKLDQELPKIPDFVDTSIGNKFKSENLYTLALPKMNFGRPKEYYVLRNKNSDLLKNSQRPHRFSNSVFKVTKNSNVIEKSEINNNHEELKNLAVTHPEIFESVTLKDIVDQHSSKLKVSDSLDDGVKFFNKEIKNKFLSAPDVSHVHFKGMGTTYEF